MDVLAKPAARGADTVDMLLCRKSTKSHPSRTMVMADFDLLPQTSHEKRHFSSPAMQLGNHAGAVVHAELAVG